MTDEGKLERIATGLRGRTLKTAKLASRMGLRYAKRVVGSADAELTPQMRERAVERAEALVEELGALKGLVMKVGQIASYMPGAMPPEAQRVLARLQAKTTAMVYERVRDVIREELGGEPDEIFERFEQTPFAAASIGQVHRATLGGVDVAVKVQYPGIEDVLRSDLRTVGVLARISSMGSGLEGGALVEELRERIVEECDYRLEADNQELFRRLWSEDANAQVPGVVRSHTTKRVLTTELVEAADFQAFCDQAPQDVRDRAAAKIFGICFHTVFHHCVYNADPHPGNYLFHEDGAVTFLDFGCIRRFDAEMIDTWKRAALAVVDGDQPRFERCYRELGFCANPAKFDWDHQWAVMKYLYRPFTERGFRYTHEYVQKSYGLLIFDNPNRMHTAMPAQWLFLNRLQWGMNSVLAFLQASGPWPELWRAAVQSETRPAA